MPEKYPTPAEPDPEMQAIDKRRELLAAHRAVATHVAWIQDIRERAGCNDGSEHAAQQAADLATVARFLAAEIEQLEQAE